jgi:hypothetical protein
MTAPRPWSTQPITGAQHDAWMAEERCEESKQSWVMPEICTVCGELLCEELDYLHSEVSHERRLRLNRGGN